MTFTLNDALQMADRQTFQRGYDYARSGRVRQLEEDGDSLTGIVIGSGSRLYTVQVSREYGEVSSLCSCPVEIDCKHGVAAIVASAEARQSSLPQTQGGIGTARESALDVWMRELDGFKKATNA